jgi:hypothetical protein
MKLNRELLPTEKSIKEKMPVSSESWSPTILISNIARIEVSELEHSLSLIDSTAQSHTEGTRTAME